MTENSVGIVGGLGPEATAKFYMDIIEKFRDNSTSYPSIVIDNVAFPLHLEEDIIQKSKNEDRLLPFLKESIKRLNRCRIDFIVIPCNTVHIFIDELKKKSSVPVIDIVQETVNFVKDNGYRKIGLLATSKTVDSKLYETRLINSSIKTILPTKKEQRKLSKIIVKILKNNINRTDTKEMSNIISSLVKRKAEAILLGCTDLQLILKENKFEIPLIDSMEILEKSTFKRLVKEVK